MLLPLLCLFAVVLGDLAPLKEYNNTIDRVKDGVAQRKYIALFNNMAPTFGDKPTLVSWAALHGVKPEDVLHYYAIGKNKLLFHGFSAWLGHDTLLSVREQSIVEVVYEDVVVSLDFTREPLLKGVTQVPSSNTEWQQRVDWGQARVNGREWNLNTYNTSTGLPNTVYNNKPPAIYANPYPTGQPTQFWNWTNTLYQLPSTGGKAVVWIVDTGIKIDHVEFLDKEGKSRVDLSVNFVDAPDNGIDDLNGHGTHCAGTAAGNFRGIAKDAVIRSVRVLGANGGGTWAGVIAGIDFVANQQVGEMGNILSASLGGGGFEAVDKAVDAAVVAGVIAVVAAGNNNNDACLFNSPARASQAIAVAATDSTDTIASFSSWGGCIKSIAPGVSITSAWITPNGQTGNNWYNDISGTSMATPHVAGAIAVHVSTGDIILDPSTVKADLALDQTKGAVQGLTGTKVNTPNFFLYSQWKQEGV